MTKILVVTGSSGGHIFPALGFLDALSDRYKNIDSLLVLSRNSLIHKISNLQHKVNYISISPIRPRLNFKSLRAILNFLKGVFESIGILLRFKPDIVVGFGTIVSIPIVMFAWLLGIKTLIHEQNVIPGRANKFLAKFTNRIAISFEETKDYFKRHKNKVVLTGSPRRKGLERIDKVKALNFFGFNNGKFTILVMGGSQGSRKINLGFLRVISKILDKFKLQIIHLAGSLDYDLLRQNYRDLQANIQLFSFLEPMQYAYSACDLVVSRGGATAITEIIFFRIPAIIIPYPFAYKHQMANARVLEKIGSALIIQDDELDKDIFKDTIENLLDNPQKINTMRLCYDNISRFNINDSLLSEILSY